MGLEKLPDGQELKDTPSQNVCVCAHVWLCACVRALKESSECMQTCLMTRDSRIWHLYGDDVVGYFSEEMGRSHNIKAQHCPEARMCPYKTS